MCSVSRASFMWWRRGFQSFCAAKNLLSQHEAASRPPAEFHYGFQWEFYWLMCCVLGLLQIRRWHIRVCLMNLCPSVCLQTLRTPRWRSPPCWPASTAAATPGSTWSSADTSSPTSLAGYPAVALWSTSSFNRIQTAASAWPRCCPAHRFHVRGGILWTPQFIQIITDAS